MQDNDEADESPSLVTKRTMDLVVAGVLLLSCIVVFYDSVRLGFGWIEGQGPAPGYFPFWIAVLLTLACVMIAIRALRMSGPAAMASFVSRTEFGRVLSVLVPTIFYVGMIQLIGIYVASALFIMAFMIYFGREPVAKALGIGVAVPLLLFFMFEKWFLVPLPKGPLEAMLGLG